MSFASRWDLFKRVSLELFLTVFFFLLSRKRLVTLELATKSQLWYEFPINSALGNYNWENKYVCRLILKTIFCQARTEKQYS